MTIEQNLRDEISLYFTDRNKQAVSKSYTLESEIAYLRSRVESLHLVISSGRAKPYHKDMFLDLEDELQTKEQRQSQLSSQTSNPDLQESQLDIIKQDFHLIINLLDSDNRKPSTAKSNVKQIRLKSACTARTEASFITIQVNCLI